MKRFLLILALWLSIVAGAVAQTATPPKGSGTEADPYQIATLDNLYWLSQNPDIRNDSKSARYYFVQTADIDATSTKDWDSGKGFTPIRNNTKITTFQYDGQGHAITKLYINRPNQSDVGLFGCTNYCTVKGITLISPTIKGGENTGSIAGNGWGGAIYGCKAVDGSITGAKNTGGLVGMVQKNCTLDYCSATGTVKASGPNSGGLAGNIYCSDVRNCYSTASVAGTTVVGGLTGYFNVNTAPAGHGAIDKCYSAGAVTGTSDLGGLVGFNLSDYKYMQDKITNSYYDKEVSKQNAIGGTSKTTADMKKRSTYAGWNFLGETTSNDTHVWAFLANQNNGYPTIVRIIQLAISEPTITTKEYDGSNVANITSTGDVSGIVNGDDVRVIADARYNNADAGTGKTITVTYTLEGANKSFYLAPAPRTLTGEIKAKEITVIPDPIQKTYGDDDPDISYKTEPDFSRSDITGSLSRDKGKDVGSYRITIGNLQPTTSNYKFTLAEGYFKIVPKRLYLDLPPTITKVYDGTTKVTTPPSVGGIIAGDDASVAVTASYYDKNVGTDRTVNFSLAISGKQAGNYTLPVASPIYTAVITPAGLTVTPKDMEKKVGRVYSFTGTEFTASDLFEGDKLTSVTLTSDGAAATAAINSYDIKASNAQGTGLSNYSISYNNGTLSVVEKLNQTITFANPGAQPYGTTPTLSATATSNLPVTFTTITSNVCSISSDGKLSFASAGTCTVVADQAGDADYKAAPSVPQSFAVTPVAPAAPTAVTAIAGDNQATVNFFQLNDGGAPITNYTVTATPGGNTATGTRSPIVVNGLTNGTAYTFTVTATNSVKESVASAASAPVTPVYKPKVLIVTNSGYDGKNAAAQLEKDLSDQYYVTVSTSVPASLVGYAQIYDVRVDEPLTVSELGSYNYFLTVAPNPSLFLAGERHDISSFNTRNQSISTLIEKLGGGIIAPPSKVSAGTVALKTPFNTGASSIATVTLSFPGITTTTGTGSFIATEADGTSGAGVYFPKGKLAKAPTGCLVVMYDVNFLYAGILQDSDGNSPVYYASSNQKEFRANLEQVMASVENPAGPSASTINLSGTPNPTAQLSPVTFTATVTPRATGEVQFVDVTKDGTTDVTTVLGSATLENSVATFTTTALGLGTHNITAKYIGDANFNASYSNGFKLNVYDVPDAPTIGAATAGDGQATVSFTPPAYDGGLPITGYTVTATPGNVTATGTSSPITVTGLANGTEYSFTVTASNAVGTSVASKALNNITPMHTSVITWSNPADIVYGTSLGKVLLKATADVPGKFTSTPDASTVLNAGNGQTITATFTPNDKGNTSVSKTLTINVAKAPLTVTASSHTITKGENIPALGVSYSGFVNGEDERVLNTEPTATTTAPDASTVGKYATTATGGVDNNYSFTYVDGELAILDKRIPVVSWPEPAAITYGTALTNEQLNATASYSDAAIAGTFTYLPAAGSTLAAGKHDLKVTFTPNDDVHYISVEKTVSITVAKALLTATASSYSIREGEAIPALGVTYKGFVNGEDEKVLDTKPTATATATTPTGVYDITVAGGADDNYEFAYVAGKLTVSNPIVVNALQTPQPACEGDKLSLTYTLTSGKPTEYQVVFDAKAQAAGFSNSSYAALPSDNGTVTFSIPSRVADGTYQAALQLRDGYGNVSEQAAFQVTVNVSADVIVPKFGSVVLIDNHDGRFTGYQWYKNGSAIGGATNQFYKDPNGLSGTYYAQIKTATGQTVNTCSKALSIKKSAQASVSVYPNPARAGQEFSVKLSGFGDEELQGALLSVYNTQGIPVLTSRKVEQENRLTLSGTDGVYMGRITTVEGQVLTFKVVLAN